MIGFQCLILALNSISELAVLIELHKVSIFVGHISVPFNTVITFSVLNSHLFLRP